MILPMQWCMLDCCLGLQYIARFQPLLKVFYSSVMAYLPTAGGLLPRLIILWWVHTHAMIIAGFKL